MTLTGFPVTPPPPLRRPVLFDQTWVDLTFIHWPVRPDGLAGPPWSRSRLTPMLVRRRVSKALMAAVCGGFFVAVPMVVAAPASACPIGHLADPITGQCFVANSGVPTVGGIPCIPGKSLGTCLGILQNQSPPGGGPPVGGPWP